MWKRRKGMIAAVAAAVAVSTIALVLTGVIPFSSSRYCFGVQGTPRTFAIIANTNGYNSSWTKAVLGVWPVMRVSRCDTITIKVVNDDTQAHGVAVEVLAMPGVVVPAGQALALKFFASRAGQFRVYCTVSCTVHEYMQNGLLSVT